MLKPACMPFPWGVGSRAADTGIGMTRQWRRTTCILKLKRINLIEMCPQRCQPPTHTHPHPPTHQHPPARPSTYAHSGTVDHCMHRRLLARTILHAPSRTSTHKLHAPSPTSTQSPHRITWWTCVCLTRGHGHEVSAFVRGLIS